MHKISNEELLLLLFFAVLKMDQKTVVRILNIVNQHEYFQLTGFVIITNEPAKSRGRRGGVLFFVVFFVFYSSFLSFSQCDL